MRSQRERCRVSEKIDAVVQRGKRSSVQFVAWISRRIHKFRTLLAFEFLSLVINRKIEEYTDLSSETALKTAQVSWVY